MSDTTIFLGNPSRPRVPSPDVAPDILSRASAPHREVPRDFSHEEVLALVKEHGAKSNPIKLCQEIGVDPLDSATGIITKSRSINNFEKALYLFTQTPHGLEEVDEKARQMIASVRSAFNVVDSMFKLDLMSGKETDRSVLSRLIKLENKINKYSPAFSTGHEADGLEACRCLRVIYLEKLVSDRVIDTVPQLARALGKESSPGAPNHGLSAVLGEVMFHTEHPGIKRLFDEFEKSHRAAIAAGVKSNEVNGKPAYELSKMDRLLSFIGAPIRWLKGE